MFASIENKKLLKALYIHPLSNWKMANFNK